MSSIDIKELKESLGFGLVFATIKAGFDYLNGRKPTMTYFAKNGGIAASKHRSYGRRSPS